MILHLFLWKNKIEFVFDIYGVEQKKFGRLWKHVGEHFLRLFHGLYVKLCVEKQCVEYNIFVNCFVIEYFTYPCFWHWRNFEFDFIEFFSFHKNSRSPTIFDSTGDSSSCCICQFRSKVITSLAEKKINYQLILLNLIYLKKNSKDFMWHLEKNSISH